MPNDSHDIRGAFEVVESKIPPLSLAADECPPQGRAKRVNGGIFDSGAVLIAAWGPKSDFRENLGNLCPLPNYKSYVQRCIEL